MFGINRLDLVFLRSNIHILKTYIPYIDAAKVSKPLTLGTYLENNNFPRGIDNLG